MRNNMRSWRDILTDTMGIHQECWSDVVACTLTDEQLDAVFDTGYDGSEWADSAPRNPQSEAESHVGG